MQTIFSLLQLRDPATAASNQVLRTCVHCGMCTATCPTFVLLGDELDSPRGRIYLIKDMLESGRPATEEVVRHVDRCLSCLSCMTTCPSGVNYMHLVDHARTYIEQTYRRPWHDALLRALLAAVLPYPGRFRRGAGRGAAGAAVRPAAAAPRHAVPAAAGDAGDGAGVAAAAGALDGVRRALAPRARGASGWRCWPAARSGCSTRRSTTPPSAC